MDQIKTGGGTEIELPSYFNCCIVVISSDKTCDMGGSAEFYVNDQKLKYSNFEIQTSLNNLSGVFKTDLNPEPVEIQVEEYSSDEGSDGFSSIATVDVSKPKIIFINQY